MEIRFAGILSKDEYLKAMRLHFKTKKYFLVLGLAFIALVLLDLATNPDFREDIWLLPFIFAVVIIIFWGNRKRRIYRTWKQYKAIKEPQAGLITEQSIVGSNERGNETIRWDYFIKYKCTDDIVLLYQSTDLFNIFPRSFFQSDNDWNSFIKIVKDNVPSK